MHRMELSVADDIQESNECNHFTIRGYVAEVRKRDAKKCFPILLHNCALLEPANLFPPLHDSKFRRWDCQRCVYEIIAATGQMDIEGGMSIHNKDMNSNNNLLLGKDAETSQLDAGKAFSRLPHNLNENLLKGMLHIKDCSVKLSRAGKQGNEWLRRDLIKEGVHNYKDAQDSQAQVQDTIEVNCLSHGRNPVNKRRGGKYRRFVGRKKIEVANVKDAINAALVQHKRSKLQKFGHSKMLDVDATSIRVNLRLCCSKEDQMPERKRVEKLTSSNVRQGHTTIDMTVKTNAVQDSDPAHTFSLGASCHDKGTCGISGDNSKYMGLTDGEQQIQNEVENFQIKKIRKVRLLQDIVRSEKQLTSRDRKILDDNSKNIQRDFMRKMLDDNAKTIHHDFFRSQDASKEKVLLLNHKSQGACTNNFSKYVRGKIKIQSSFGEDKVLENAVTHTGEKYHCVQQRSQLKSVKRKNVHEKYSEVEGPFYMHWMNNMHEKENGYKREADTKHIRTNSFLSDHSADLSCGNDQNLDAGNNGMIKPTFNRKLSMGLKDGQVTSSILICEEMNSKKFSSQNISASKNAITGKTRGMSDGIGGEENLHIIKNKTIYGDQVTNHQVKDSSTQNNASFDEGQKVSKKQGSNEITEQEAIDDIPMDIVELLARNQQERLHLKAEGDATNKLEFPAKNESIKCSFDISSSQISRNNVANAEEGNLLCQNFQVKGKEFDVWTTFPCTTGIGYKPKDCSCSFNGKRMLQIDLNQHHSDPLVGEAGFCKDINMNCRKLNFSCCRRNNMHSLTCLEDQNTVDNIPRNLYHSVLQHRNGATFGCKSHFLNNSNASVCGSNLEIFALSGESEKPRNLVGKHHYWGFPQTTPNAFSSMDFTKGCHSNVGPPNLCSNGTISALNLLRLMDQAAVSGEPLQHFQNYSRHFNETDVCVNGQYNELQLEYGNRENDTCICQLEVVNPTARQQLRNSSLLFRPHPRIGSLGPSLQREIFHCANYSSIPTSNSYGYPTTDVKEKTNPSHLSPNICMCNSHTSLFRRKCSEIFFPDSDPDRCSTSNTRCSVAKVGVTRVESNNQVDSLLPFGSFCKKEICVVNRNPAEFTVLDENNEYMIEIKELKSLRPRLRGPLHGQKKQKIMKLNDLKAFAM